MAFGAKNNRLLAGATGVAVGLKRMGVFQGQFAVPAVSIDSVIDTYVPLAYGASALLPKISLPAEKTVLAVSLGVVAFRTLFQMGRTELNFDNVVEGYLPAGAAALILLR